MLPELLNIAFAESTLKKYRSSLSKWNRNTTEITIIKSKTDQIREGNIVFIAEVSITTCPVFWKNISRQQDFRISLQDIYFADQQKPKKVTTPSESIKYPTKQLAKLFQNILIFSTQKTTTDSNRQVQVELLQQTAVYRKC